MSPRRSPRRLGYIAELGGELYARAAPPRLLTGLEGMDLMAAKLALGVIDENGQPILTRREWRELIPVIPRRLTTPILEAIDELSGVTDHGLRLRFDPHIPRSARSIVRTQVAASRMARRRTPVHRGRSRCPAVRRRSPREVSRSSSSGGGDPPGGDEGPGEVDDPHHLARSRLRAASCEANKDPDLDHLLRLTGAERQAQATRVTQELLDLLGPSR